MVSHTFNVLYKSTPGIMDKNISAVVAAAEERLLLPLSF